MDGLMTDNDAVAQALDANVATMRDLAAAGALKVKAQHYDTAMRKVRLSYTTDAWKNVMATTTRHYKTGKGLRTGSPTSLVAWMHAIDASPWVLHGLWMEAGLSAAYIDGADTLTTGAAALSDMPALRVVQIDTVGQIEAWLQRIGPCVLGGTWGADMNIVARDTETVGARRGAPFPHAVALVGLKPNHVRLVNNEGAAWGALGRAWMPTSTVEAILSDGGEAWGVVPVDLTPKRGAK